MICLWVRQIFSQGVWDHDGMLPGAGVEVHTGGSGEWTVLQERTLVVGREREKEGRAGQGEEDGLGCRRRCTDGR